MTASRGASWLTLLLAQGCTRPPQGAPGHRLDERLVECAPWQPWPAGSGFATCSLSRREVVFGRAATVTLVRGARGVEGWMFAWGRCDDATRAALRRAVRGYYGLDAGGEVYQQWDDAEVLRLDERGGECSLVVAGPRFGPAYVARELARGLGAILRVH